MMSVLEYRFQARHAVLAFACLLFAACANVLGIEDRELDDASSYPLEGYEGCRPGVSCDRCLDVHQARCEAGAFCADTSGLGACATCVCDNCREPVTECRIDAECEAIWQCLQQTRCDLSNGAEGSCRDACGSVIEANGGVSGRAFRDAAAIRTCAITESCLSCLPAQRDVPPPGCTPDNNCVGCDDCFQQCLCSGEQFAACQDLCGEDAPPEACSSADDCAGCASCFQVCACQGGAFEQCAEECQGGVPPQCTLAESCVGCTDCISQCQCEGGETLECQAACAPPPGSDVCVETSSGSGSDACGGCTSCLADCTCEGTPVEQCLDDCDMDGCCEGGSCTSFYYDCVCPADSSSQACAEEFYSCSAAFGCDQCTCSGCRDLFAMCQEISGCRTLFECMRATGCEGRACAERCMDERVQSGDSEAFAVAEALWACDKGAGCTCDEQGPAAVFCGTAECSSYETNDVTFDACCPGDFGGVEPAGQGTAEVAGGVDGCGLSLKRHFQNAPACMPMNQPNAPPILPLFSCPQGRVEAAPYNNAALKGCCRDDGICGYWDDITGLGCIDSSVFDGVAPSPCN